MRYCCIAAIPVYDGGVPKKTATIQARGVLTLPADIRTIAGLEPGSLVEILFLGPGRIEIRRLAVVAPTVLLAEATPGASTFESDAEFVEYLDSP